MGQSETKLTFELVDDPLYDVAIFICHEDKDRPIVLEYRVMIGVHSKYSLEDIDVSTLSEMVSDSLQRYKQVFSRPLGNEEYLKIINEIDDVRGLFYCYRINS